MSDGERESRFVDLLAGCKAILFKVVHTYAFKHADRQDLFQDIVLQLWRSLDAFRGDASLSTWVYRIALNTAIGWTRKDNRHRQGKRPIDEVEGWLTIEPLDGCNPRLEWLYQKISELNEVDRSVVLLWLDGHAYKEIAEILGMSESNVGVKINRIKSALADERTEKQTP